MAHKKWINPKGRLWLNHIAGTCILKNAGIGFLQD